MGRQVIRRVLAPLVASGLIATSVISIGHGAGAAVTTHGFGSVDAAYLTGPSGATAKLYNATHQSIGSGTIDDLGAFVVHDVVPGSGYTFSVTSNGATTVTPAFKVLNQTTPPPASFYKGVTLHVGLNYLPMRDGITLAATVRLPAGKTSLSQGPFPTLIEYSGYGTAAPGSLLDAELGKYTGNRALLPDSATVVGAVIAPSLGFATVSLQMRGSGCSGGAFDLFGPSEPTDGYDAIQEVAGQKWVSNHKVGLVGISYSGISQFGVAGLNPPGLAAIAPLSPTDDLYSTGSPGGIANTGFAAGWIADRVHDAKPASATTGQSWAWAEIQAGDTTCLGNQQFHGQAQDVQGILSNNLNRVPSLYDPRSPVKWASHIKVPVFVVGALQDEQTGPQWPTLITALKSDPTVYATLQNGTHGDSLDPDVSNRWIAFNDLYVAKAVPKAPGLIASLILGGLSSSIGGPVAIPAIPGVGSKNYAAALAAFKASQPRVTVNFDNGNSTAGLGKPQAAYSASYSAFPPTTASATSLYLGNGGTLSSTPATGGTTEFNPDPAARPAVTGAAPDFSAWASAPDYNWTQVGTNSAAGFISAPLTSNTTVVGGASLNLQLASSTPAADLQATISEVRPDGTELYVTSGFFRATYAGTLVPSASTVFAPAYTYATATALTPNHTYALRIPIDPIAFTFRAGDRIRVTIEAPGGDRPSWAFANTPAAGATDTITLAGSALVLPVVAGVVPSDSDPVCNISGTTASSNRGQPCRTYAAAANGG